MKNQFALKFFAIFFAICMLAVLVFFMFWGGRSDFFFYLKYIRSNQDIVIHQYDVNAGTNDAFHAYYVNLKKQKAYHVKNYPLWAPSPNGDAYYSLEETISLSDENKELLLQTISTASGYRLSPDKQQALAKNYKRMYYYLISYQGTDFLLSEKGASKIDTILGLEK